MAQLKSVEFDGNEELAFVTVRMSAEEAALIAIFTGKNTLSSAEEVMAGGSPASTALYQTLVGNVFNKLYSGGVEEWHAEHF